MEEQEMIDLLCLADEALMMSHGCFPLDRVTESERFLNDAARKIREVTGDDYENRKLRARRARFKAQP